MTRSSSFLCCCFLLRLLALSHVRADSAWNFDSITSKADAMRQIQQQWASVAPADFIGSGSGSVLTPGQAKLSNMYADYLSTYNLTTTTKQYKGSYANFRQNMESVYRVNTDPSLTWFASGNEFSGYSFADFASMRLMTTTIDEPLVGSSNMLSALDDATLAGIGFFGRRSPPPSSLSAKPPPPPSPRPPSPPPPQPPPKSVVVAPPPSVSTTIDWVAAGKVTPIKDQGACGSCWAFSAIATIESALLIRQPNLTTLLNLSEQQLVSCATAAAGYGSLGCNGGYSDQALRYVYGNAEALEGSYPYTGTSSACAPFTGQAVRVAGAVSTTPTLSEAAFVTAMGRAPFAFYFAVASDFQHYAGGVYAPSATCGTTALNHAMTAVGYSRVLPSGGGSSYWLVKNSWGTGWGAGGYVKIQATGDGRGACGMYTHGGMQ